MDMRQDTTTSNGSTNEQVEFFVTSDGELQVSWSYSLNSKILGGVT